MNKLPTKPANEIFTDKQWQSIFDGGDNLLVAASAGSGKTAVLVRRVIEKIRSGLNINELLIVTYTEAAASEMKERIQTALQEAVNLDAAMQQHYAKQLTLLPTANISTLHAFCLRVVQRFYYVIDLDPRFRMLTDETETLLLKEEVWEMLRDGYYKNDQEENQDLFYRLTANFSNDRSDAGLTDLIFSLYEFARVNPNPEQWLKDLVSAYQVEHLEESTLYQDVMKPLIEKNLHDSYTAYQSAIVLAEGEEAFKKLQDLLRKEFEVAKKLAQLFSGSRLQEFYQELQLLRFDRFSGSRKAEFKETSDEIKRYRDAAKASLLEIKEQYFATEPNEQVHLMQEAAVFVGALAEIEANFIKAYSKRKRTEGLVDFNDLEHFAYAILTKISENGTQEASSYYRSLFKEVLVDEYQDVNRLQEAILENLRTPDGQKGNLFMVGDVKQSIYSFRLADPTLFIEKYEAYADEDGGRRIILAENFRSRKEVLDFTNLIFSQLMDRSVGQITYDEEAMLVNGYQDFPDDASFKPELLVFEKGEHFDSEAIEDKTDGELYLTALKIRELHDSGFQIYDKKDKIMKPIKYQDIVLLTPTKKNNLVILDIFKQLGIPLEVNDAQNYFQATEIQTILSLLQLIDNPYQDIPLAAVLRSPIVGLTEKELAEIRIIDRENSYYQAVKEYALLREDALTEKLTSFLEQMTRWRKTARREAISELLWQIYDETAYLDYVMGLPSGKQRHANLLALVERAKTYESSSFRGLYQFMRFIEKMREKDKDLAEPLVDSEEDAVKVMTIHASKGLEFPVVFLLDSTKTFNMQDLRERYVFDEKAGIGIKYLDQDLRVLHDTMPYEAIKQIKLQKLLSEEMRKLYVALTRAEQKLYIVGSYKDQAAMINSWRKNADSRRLVLDEKLRLSMGGSFMDWIGMSLFRHPKMDMYQNEYPHAKMNYLETHPGDFAITTATLSEIEEQLAKIIVRPSQETSHDTVLAGDAKKLKERLEFEYAFPQATHTTSYQSVSEIKRIFEDPDNQSEGQMLLTPQDTTVEAIYRYTQEELAKPNFLQKKQPTGADIGTATHTLLQLLSLDQVPTKENIQELIDQLVRKRLLLPEVAEKIDVKQIIDFFKTSLGQELLTNNERVHREEPFAMLLPADQIFTRYDQTNDEILIHGIVDGYIEYDDHLVLYDFKTDYVGSQKNVKNIVERYIGQLRLYKDALEKSLEKPVDHTYLVLLRNNQIVEVTKKL